jgi:hypothetical protein
MPRTLPRRALSCTLLALASVSLAVQAEESVQVARSVRLEEGRQKGVGTLTMGISREIKGLVQEYEYNGIGQEAQLAVLGKLSESLTRLADANSAAGTENMPWVVTRLAAARELKNLADLRKELLSASGGQDKIVKQLTELLASVQKEFGKVGVKGDLKDLIQEQAKLKQTTEKLGDQTLGKKAENLNPEQKADLEKVAQQQNALEQGVQAAVENLKAQAQELAKTDPAQAKNVEDAVKELEKDKVEEAMQQAADKVADNQMAKAEEKQQQALDALNQAQKKLEQTSTDPLAKLEQDLAKLDSLVQKEQDLLDKTNALDQNSKQDDFNQLQKDQAEVQGDLAQLQQDSAQQQAEQAQKNAIEKQKEAKAEQQKADQLQAQKSPEAPAAEQQAQQAQQAADQAEQQAQQAAQDAGAPPEAQAAQAEAAKDQAAADQAQAQGQGEKAEKAQDAAIAAMEKAEKALEAGQDAGQEMAAAEQALGQEDQKAAAGDEAKALAAMQAMQAAMQGQLAAKTGQGQEPPHKPDQDPHSKVKDPKELKTLTASLKYGATKTAGEAAAWQVGLAPAERDALTGAGKDKFPARYEQQLALYYQNLANGGPAK